jgi:hypothetical protein
MVPLGPDVRYVIVVVVTVVVVGIATGYRLDDRGFGVRVPVGSRIVSTSSKLALRSPQPSIQWVPRGSFPGGKAAGA